MKSHLSAAAAALVLFAATAAEAVPVHYTSAWFFGDSLSDPGNLFKLTDGARPQSPPYFEGRFSNGPVWAEAVGAKFADKGLGTRNFAYGGATALESDDGVPDLPDQIDDFASGGFALGDRPLAAVWIGANDVFGAIAADPTPINVATTAANAAGAVGAGIGSLIAAGVDDFLVFNMPPLELTPQFALLNPQAAPLAFLATETFNATLALQLAALGQSAEISLFDTHAVFLDLFADPAKYGVSDVTNPCILPGVSVCTPDVADERAFYDPVHPNRVLHGDIAEIVLEDVAPVPLPAPALLLLAGLAGLAAFGRRRG
jgi:outer membrane lipase/esterase